MERRISVTKQGERPRSLGLLSKCWTRDRNGRMLITSKMYRKFNNELCRETDGACAKWWESQCNKLEDLERIGRSDLIYAKVKELCQGKRRGKKRESVLSKHGALLTDPGDIKRRWKEYYIEELYGKDEKPDSILLKTEEEVDINSLGPDVLKEEIIKAIHQLSNGKLEGVEGIPAEMWKEIGSKEFKVEICRAL